jgi:hypothetical protein
LCCACADLLRSRLAADIPDNLVKATIQLIIADIDIKEAYLYRDWQSAIGDMMIVEINNAARRFDVIGYREFARKHVCQNAECNSDKLWFERLDNLFCDLDMSKQGEFDARRKQIREVGILVEELKSELSTQLTTANVP